MSCEHCDDTGYIDKSVGESTVPDYEICQGCTTPCEKCDNTGWHTTLIGDEQKPCEVCWEWKLCDKCGGDEVSGMVYKGSCDFCSDYRNPNGLICTGWAREDTGIPDRKPQSYLSMNI